MIRISDILEYMAEYVPEDQLKLVKKAYVFSAKVHEGQVRLSGEPYLSHPLEVAGILARMNMDVTSVAAALLHDVIEDTKATESELEELFGEEVLHIVSGVTKLGNIPSVSATERKAESIRKMILAMADDIRVILIKLADRLHNMRTLGYHKPSKRIEIAQETLDIYAPIAGRLGIYWIKKELEDTSFKYLHPHEYEVIVSLLNKGKEESEKYIETVKKIIKEQMSAQRIECEVLGRYKHYYSIYQKMVSQNLPFEEIYDILAFRIILETVSQCYEALGIIHSIWKPIPKKFKDYISVPKSNMYQSLHTTVIGPYGERVELQIRTREMDRVANSGIAAHWSYKEGHRVDEKLTERFAWIQNLVETQASFRDPNEFMENVRIDLFPDEVYVFTPQGDIKTLPKDATPVDFAYMIHTEVGNRCTGAKVNGRMVPLKHRLNTGDTVEIITSKGGHPSKDWLHFVKTVKARSKIRQWIKVQEKERSISLGREMCEKAFKKYRLNFNSILKSEEFRAVVEDLGFKTDEDLIASVGYGKITPLQIIRRIVPKESSDLEESILGKIVSKVKRKRPKTGVLVRGADDILVRFGKCCNPVPGDPITGYITRGYGVTIHRSSCVNALKINPERRIEVEWTETSQERFPVKIRVFSYDRMGLLADVASVISQNGANIINADSKTRENNTVESHFTLMVENTAHLHRVISAMKKVKHVTDVKRVAV